MDNDRFLVNRLLFDIETDIQDCDLDLFKEFKELFYELLLSTIEGVLIEHNSKDLLVIEKIEIDIGVFKVNKEYEFNKLHNVIILQIQKLLQQSLSNYKVLNNYESSYLEIIKEILIKGHSSRDFFFGKNDLSLIFRGLTVDEKEQFHSFVWANFKSSQSRNRFFLQFDQRIIEDLLASKMPRYKFIYTKAQKFYNQEKELFIELDQKGFTNTFNLICGDYYASKGKSVTALQVILLELINRSSLKLLNKRKLIEKAVLIEFESDLADDIIAYPSEIEGELKSITSDLILIEYFIRHHSFPKHLNISEKNYFANIVENAIENFPSEFKNLLISDVSYSLRDVLLEIPNSIISDFIYISFPVFRIEKKEMLSILQSLAELKVISIHKGFDRAITLLFLNSLLKVERNGVVKLDAMIVYLARHNFIKVLKSPLKTYTPAHVKVTLESLLEAEHLILDQTNRNSDLLSGQHILELELEPGLDLTVEFLENLLLHYLQINNFPWWASYYLSKLKTTKGISIDSDKGEIIYCLLSELRNLSSVRFNLFLSQFIDNTILRNYLVFDSANKLEALVFENLFPELSRDFFNRVLFGFSKFFSAVIPDIYFSKVMYKRVLYIILPWIKSISKLDENSFQRIAIQAFSVVLKIDFQELIKTMRFNMPILVTELGGSIKESELFIESIQKTVILPNDFSVDITLDHIIKELNSIEIVRGELLKSLYFFIDNGILKGSVFKDFNCLVDFFDSLEFSDEMIEQDAFQSLKKDIRFKALISSKGKSLSIANESVNDSILGDLTKSDREITIKNTYQNQLFTSLIIFLNSSDELINNLLEWSNNFQEINLENKLINDIIEFSRNNRLEKSPFINKPLLDRFTFILNDKVQNGKRLDLIKELREQSLGNDDHVISILESLYQMIGSVNLELEIQKELTEQDETIHKSSILAFYKESPEAICETLNYFLIHLELPWWSVYSSYIELQTYYSRLYSTNKYDLAKAFQTITANKTIFDKLKIYFSKNNNELEMIDEAYSTDLVRNLLAYQFQDSTFNGIREELSWFTESLNFISQNKPTIFNVERLNNVLILYASLRVFDRNEGLDKSIYYNYIEQISTDEKTIYSSLTLKAIDFLPIDNKSKQLNKKSIIIESQLSSITEFFLQVAPNKKDETERIVSSLSSIMEFFLQVAPNKKDETERIVSSLSSFYFQNRDNEEIQLVELVLITTSYYLSIDSKLDLSSFLLSLRRNPKLSTLPHYSEIIEFSQKGKVEKLIPKYNQFFSLIELSLLLNNEKEFSSKFFNAKSLFELGISISCFSKESWGVELLKFMFLAKSKETGVDFNELITLSKKNFNKQKQKLYSNTYTNLLEVEKKFSAEMYNEYAELFNSSHLNKKDESVSSEYWLRNLFSEIHLNPSFDQLYKECVLESEFEETLELEGSSSTDGEIKWPKLKDGDKIYVPNAGVVLIWPFLSTLFKNLNYTKKGEFKNRKAQHRAIHLIQFLVDGQENTPEFVVILNKIICGVSIMDPISMSVKLTKKEKIEANHFMETVLSQWKEMKNTSLDNFRKTFLQRGGILHESNGKWFLKVEHKSIDVLLMKLPWGLSMIKLPWNKYRIIVEWNAKN